MKIQIVVVICAILLVANVLAKTGQIHDQPNPEDIPDEWNPRFHREIGFNLFHNPVIVSNNYLLSVDDEVCLGDDIQLFNNDITAEWFSKGGPEDSPPVLFVDDLEAAKQKIRDGDLSFIPEMYQGSMCSGMSYLLHFEGLPIGTRQNNWILNCVFEGQVVCEDTCDETTKDNTRIPSDKVKLLSDGRYNFNCDISCFLLFHKIGEGTPLYIPGYRYGTYETRKFFMSRRVAGYLTKETNTISDLKFPETGTNSLGFTSEITFAGVVDKDGPEFTIEENGYNPDIGVLQATITNTGDIGATVDSISLPNTPGAKIIYAPTKLGPGESDDVLISVPESDIVDLDIAYRAEQLGCQDKKEYANTYSFNLANAADPYEKEKEAIKNAGYDVILKKGAEPEKNLLDLRLIMKTK